MVTELRRIKLILDQLGIRIRTEWIPFIMNYYDDALSRSLLSRDLHILPRLWRYVVAGMLGPRDSFPFKPMV